MTLYRELMLIMDVAMKHIIHNLLKRNRFCKTIICVRPLT